MRLKKSPAAKRLAEHGHFLQRLMSSPRHIGAIAPSSPALGRAMAAQIDLSRAGMVLELGPGSGALTRELLACGLPPMRLSVIERDPEFAARIGTRFPGVTVIRGNAFDLASIGTANFDQPLAAIVSGLPLLNFPLRQRNALLQDALSLLEPGAPFIQFSYGLQKPVAVPDGASVRHAALVWNNLPPAHVWVYRREGKL
jgi:phosphatidylethanolamine/phosphatidyl-N-methylethanolamine N-methyltransferase